MSRQAHNIPLDEPHNGIFRATNARGALSYRFEDGF
jgi:hypothetical protein